MRVKAIILDDRWRRNVVRIWYRRYSCIILLLYTAVNSVGKPPYTHYKKNLNI